MKMRPMLLAAAIATTASPAFASTQGTPGPTSTGTVTINASVTPEVNITNLDDFTFPAAALLRTLNSGGAGNVRDDSICVWSNNPDGSYFITPTGDGAGGAFTISNGTATIEYTVLFGRGPGSRTGLTAGTKSGLFNSNAASPDCNGGTNANLAIRIARAEVAKMDASTTYTGVLTLLVTPS